MQRDIDHTPQRTAFEAIVAIACFMSGRHQESARQLPCTMPVKSSNFKDLHSWPIWTACCLVADAMNIARRALPAIMIVALSLVGFDAAAETASATIGVSVRVVANAAVELESAPAGITVTEADLARGYVDLSAPINVRVRSNSSRYRLTVTAMSDAFGPATFNWDGGSMRVNAGEAWAARSSVRGGDFLALTGRVALRAGMQPGSYDLPFQFSASPL